MCCFSTGSYCWACNLWVLIIYLFFLLVMLPSVVLRLSADSPVRVFPGVWKLLSFLRLPFWDISPSLPLLYLFLSFIFFSYLLSKTMGCFSGCLMSSASIQKLFVEFTQRSNILLAGVQPQWIQGIRSGDGIGEDQETIA